jgi:hypothetical protein
MKFSILNRQIVYFDQSHATLQNLKDARLPISRGSLKNCQIRYIHQLT